MATVISIFPHKIRQEKPGVRPGIFYIEAGTLDKPSCTHIPHGSHTVYTGFGRSVSMRDLDREIARAIVQDFCRAQLEAGEDSHPGLMYVAEDVTPDEAKKKFASRLAELSRIQKNWFVKLYSMAEDDWNKHHSLRAISELQRIAARQIGKNPAWLTDPVEFESKACPACGSRLTPDAIVCSVCRCVIDKKRYGELEFA